MDHMVLHRFPSGEEIVRVDASRTISVKFSSPKKVLSTSLLNGGYREDLEGIFNYNCGRPDEKHCMGLDKYVDTLAEKAKEIGLDPARAAGIGTAASMRNAAVVFASYDALTVTACVTAGVEGNAGRAGDPASFYGVGDNPELVKPGTINILLFLGANMPAGVLARALVTCTEAKTAALQELLVGSLYSIGPATGTGTDSTILVVDPASPLYFRGAGKHGKLGELIGRTVKEAVKEALIKQNGLTPLSVHRVTYRLHRYGVTEERLFALYQENGGKEEQEGFLSRFESLNRDDRAVVWSTLYAHLLDESAWHLLRQEEYFAEERRLLHVLADMYGIPCPPVLEKYYECPVEALMKVLLACMERGE